MLVSENPSLVPEMESSKDLCNYLHINSADVIVFSKS